MLAFSMTQAALICVCVCVYTQTLDLKACTSLMLKGTIQLALSYTGLTMFLYCFQLPFLV